MQIAQSVLRGFLVSLMVFGTGWQPLRAARIDTANGVSEGDGASRQTSDGQPAATQTVHLNFKDADILQIIDLMSQLTGKNFLIDEKVRGKVTIIAPKPVSLEEAYQVFLSILEIQGYTVVPQGPIIKIVPSREVKERPLPTGTNGQLGPAANRDEYVTRLIPLEYADSNDLRALLTPLVSKQSSLLAYEPTNTLILTDLASNITRLLKIIRTLDVEAPAAVMKVVPLQYAAADQLAPALESALTGLAEAATPEPAVRRRVSRRRGRLRQAATLSRAPTEPKIIPDPRTNKLILIATPEDLGVAEELIAKLDVPTPEGRGQIHVYYLAHANAEELAQVLTAQAAEIARTTSSTQTGQQQQQQQQQQGRRQSAATTGTTPLGITITADKPTNSLVITAPPEAYAVLKDIIEKLDIRRQQVLVESLIAEITLEKANALGVEWRLINDPDKTQVFASSTGQGGGEVGPGVLNALTQNPLNPVPGLLLGALRNQITINGEEIANIPVILRAFQSDSDINVLATPNLLTTDNEEAEIIIGEERPFLRSAQDTPSGGVVSTTRTFEFRDVGITLRITPQISQNRTVRLNLFQEITNFISESETGAVTTTKRSTQTTVIVDDGQTIVIGGLIQENRNEAENKVPCLGNIPLFGAAFRQTSARKRKTNLLIFLTPHIVASPHDVERITEHKRQQSDKASEIEDTLRKNYPQENFEILLN
jgi:general secretion pathway protein D